MLANLPFPAPEGSSGYAMLFGHLEALKTYRSSDIDWTVLTPPFVIKGWTPDGVVNPTRTGKYRTSTTKPELTEEWKSELWIADLAMAAVDEIENRQFVRQRFTVGT
jgi:putative NADH-flavin reductase